MCVIDCIFALTDLIKTVGTVDQSSIHSYTG